MFISNVKIADTVKKACNSVKCTRETPLKMVQAPTDARNILSFRSCASFKH